MTSNVRAKPSTSCRDSLASPPGDPARRRPAQASEVPFSELPRESQAPEGIKTHSTRALTLKSSGYSRTCCPHPLLAFNQVSLLNI